MELKSIYVWKRVFPNWNIISWNYSSSRRLSNDILFFGVWWEAVVAIFSQGAVTTKYR